MFLMICSMTLKSKSLKKKKRKNNLFVSVIWRNLGDLWGAVQTFSEAIVISGSQNYLRYLEKEAAVWIEYCLLQCLLFYGVSSNLLTIEMTVSRVPRMVTFFKLQTSGVFCWVGWFWFFFLFKHIWEEHVQKSFI